LDTRSKIISLEQAREKLRETPARWVAGDFDPLLAEHVRRLREQAVPGQLLVVEVTNPVKPLLAQRARAELVAGLAMVDYVVLGNGAAGTILDAGVTQLFVEHVQSRQGPKGAA
jgi:bifunctional ADP-heptose synthase (sugar kinase/adenylyltransferase)